MTIDTNAVDNNSADTVRDLIDTCRDGEKGYKTAAEHAKNPEYKSMFLKFSSERGRFADQLEGELGHLGDADKNEGHATASMHRAWAELKQNLGAGDHDLLAWIEQGEDTAKAKYQKALQSNLPESVVSIIKQQASSVVAAHDRIRDLRDSKAAA